MRLSAILLGAALACVPLATSAQMALRHRGAPAAPPQLALAEKSFPFGVTWVLRSFNGKPVPMADPPSFMLDQTLRARGFSGCNSFSMALYPVKNQQLAAGAIALTHKSCDTPLLAFEHRFLIGLHSMPKWAVSPIGELTITGVGAAMQFQRGI